MPEPVQRAIIYNNNNGRYEYEGISAKVPFTQKQLNRMDRFRNLFDGERLPLVDKSTSGKRVSIGLSFQVFAERRVDGVGYLTLNRYIKACEDTYVSRNGRSPTPTQLVCEVMYTDSGLVNPVGLDWLRKHLFIHLLGLKVGSEMGGGYRVDEVLRIRMFRVRKFAENNCQCKYLNSMIKEILIGNKDEKEGIKTMSPAEGSQTREKSMAAARKSTVGKIEMLKTNAVELVARTKGEALEGVWGMGANVGVGAINRFLLAGVRRSPLSEGTKKDAEWLLQHPLAEAVTAGVVGHLTMIPEVSGIMSNVLQRKVPDGFIPEFGRQLRIKAHREVYTHVVQKVTVPLQEIVSQIIEVPGMSSVLAMMGAPSAPALPEAPPKSVTPVPEKVEVKVK